MKKISLLFCMALVMINTTASAQQHIYANSSQFGSAPCGYDTQDPCSPPLCSAPSCQQAPCPPPCAPCDPCAPCAPVCGTSCGVSICAIGVAVLAIVAAGAIILSTGESVNSH